MSIVSRIKEILKYNEYFVKNKSYEPFENENSIPNKKMVVFTCMDSRLVELLHEAMNIHNGDVKMVKNAGAIIRKPYDSIVKSILVAIYDLQAEEVAVIGHHNCGMSAVNTDNLKEKMKAEGITEETFDILNHAGIDFHGEFHGFDSVEDSVQQSVNIIRNHPLLPKYVKVHGLVVDPQTGKLDTVDLKDEADA